MEFFGLIGFCIGFGWIPILIFVALIVFLIEKIERRFIHGKFISDYVRRSR